MCIRDRSTGAQGAAATTLSSDAQSNTVGGSGAGDSFSGTSAYGNTIFGKNAGTNINTGDQNVMIGMSAGNDANTEYDNVLIGFNAGYKNGSSNNVCVGAEAGTQKSSGTRVTYVGKGAGQYMNGNDNTAIGYNSLNPGNPARTGQRNTALGSLSGRATTTGIENIYIGYNAGNNAHATGDNCIIIGNDAAATSSSVSNEITLGDANITKFRVPGINVVLKDNGGTPTQGHVLTVDASGEASFAAASGGGSSNVGITTNLSGSFTASAGSPSTINTYGYGSGDIVVEYTVFIKNGSDFQSQKLLAMRDGTTIHSTQFAVMYSSSLLVQCDATISSGNILLRATPETGVSGSTTYKIKREVM